MHLIAFCVVESIYVKKKGLVLYFFNKMEDRIRVLTVIFFLEMKHSNNFLSALLLMYTFSSICISMYSFLLLCVHTFA